jgi:hypothetical protein
MKKTILLAAPLGLAVLYGATQVTAEHHECRQMNLPTCVDANQININNRGNTAGPPSICVDPGETITVRVTPEGTEASIEGKNGGWPSGSGSEFTLVAPMEPGDYDYNVYFEDGSCLDPRVRIRD